MQMVLSMCFTLTRLVLGIRLLEEQQRIPMVTKATAYHVDVCREEHHQGTIKMACCAVIFNRAK